MAIESLLPLTGAWLWSTYGKNLANRVFQIGKEKWDEAKWNTAAKAYREKIIKLYNSMQIMGMANPVPLDDIFTEAYMLDKPTAYGRFDIERLKEHSADRDTPLTNAERINGLRLVVEKRNLIILGKPGAGKTTFLKYIALKAAEQTIDKVPIFIELKKWADSGKRLLQFIVDERFDVCGFPAAQPFVEALLKSGSAIVLFDGLDEVNQEGGQRDKQIHDMNNFIEKYDGTQCLITCRIAANDYSFEPFTYVEIADFTEPQIETFVSNWFRNNEGAKDEETCQKFLTEFKREDNKGLRDLARTPLLLTLLCLAFNETLTFPLRRVEIYQEALEALLKKWDSSRRIRRDEVYRKLSLGHKENMLARIAADAFERNEYFIDKAELETRITDYVKNVPPHETNEPSAGEVILKAIEAQHGIFVERAREVYSFSHLTFQEYFTAKYIVDNAAQGTLAELVETHTTDARWREVFLLTASLLPEASQFMKAFREVLDNLLGHDETLLEVLAWANKKSTSIQTDVWITRPSYIAVELYYLSENPYADSAFDRVFDHDLYLLEALNRLYDPTLDLDPKLVHNLDLTLDLLLMMLLSYAYTISGFEKDAANYREFCRNFQVEVARLGAAGLTELAIELSSLSLPTEETPAPEWSQFADKLRELIIRHRDIGNEWELSESQESRIASYLNASRLLQDCLKLAFMPLEEKKKMLNSLYLPLGHKVHG